MLPAGSRLRRRAEFSVVVRRGRRAARGTVVTHLYVGEKRDARPPRVGLVVPRTVGTAVARNAVRRRLRHLLRDRLGQLPRGSTLVLRAMPGAAGRSFAELTADVDGALAQVTR